MYRTRKRSEEGISAERNRKEIDLTTFSASRFSARTPSRTRRRVENAGKRGTANDREIRQIYGVSCKYAGNTLRDGFVRPSYDLTHFTNLLLLMFHL